MVTAIIQARMSSTRLPQKVLLPLGGVTVLEHTIQRAREAKRIGDVVVATSDRSNDDRIAALCEKANVKCFRGSLDDVLDRYFQAAKKCSAEHICRVTADCPLVDPEIIDRVALEYEKGKCDYISTGRVTSTYPDGMDTEIFSFAALQRAWREAKLPSEREHVTPYIWKNPQLFKIKEVKNERDLSKVRLTLDEQADYDVLVNIVANVQPLRMDAIVEYLEKNPEVAAINGSTMRDEGYQKSLKEDRI